MTALTPAAASSQIQARFGVAPAAGTPVDSAARLHAAAVLLGDERACVAEIGGGCLAPVAAYHDGTILSGLIAAEDGSWVERLAGDDPVELGRALVDLESARSRHEAVTDT